MCVYIYIYIYRPEGIYGPPGGEYDDNLFRFTLLTLACLEAWLLSSSLLSVVVLYVTYDTQYYYFIVEQTIFNILQVPQRVKIHQRGVQWKQGVVVYMIHGLFCYIILPPSTAPLSDCTPLWWIPRESRSVPGSPHPGTPGVHVRPGCRGPSKCSCYYYE